MSEMRRLRDETRSPMARALLESVADDRSESGARDRALGALGLGAVASVAATAATTAAKAATLSTVASSGVAGGGGAGGAAVPLAQGVAKGGALAVMKWIGIGVLCSGAAIGSVRYVRRDATIAAPDPAIATAAGRPDGREVSARSAGPRPAAETPAVPAAIAAPSQPLPPSDDAPSPPPRLAPPRAAEPPLAHPAGDLGDNTPASTVVTPAAEPVAVQLAALSAIRGALAAHDPARALTLLADFDRRNPSSSLAEEVAVLRIDALVDSGLRAEAETLAEAFLRAHPASVFAERVRTKLKTP
jgi:hypothetical protein